MRTIPNRTKPIAGAKYRGCAWHTLMTGNAEVCGYGLEEKKIGQSRYSLVAWKGDVAPFETQAEASKKAKQLTEFALAMQRAQPAQ